MRVASWYPAAGATVHVEDCPKSTGDEQVSVPFGPELAVTANWSTAKLAASVWLAVTFVNVKLVTAPTELPSTSTSATW